MTAMLTGFSLLAQPNETSRHGNYSQAVVTISTLTKGQVRVLVDGNTYNKNGNDNEITLTGIRTGYHSIKIYQQKYDRGRSYKNMQLVYDATIYVRPQYYIDIVINRFGRAFVDERQIEGIYFNDDNNGYGNSGGWSNNNQVMNSRSFEQFKQVLKNESFDDTRLKIAKQTIADNYFSSNQVKDILSLFSFENSKLEIAEYAYKYTTDKNNYFILNDAFSYSGSKEELARYIKAYK